MCGEMWGEYGERIIIEGGVKELWVYLILRINVTLFISKLLEVLILLEVMNKVLQDVISSTHRLIHLY